jgi:hypothetical protein
MMLAIFLLLSLGGCGAVDAVGAAARVVATGVELTGSVVGTTVDVVGSAASGAVDLATGGDGKATADQAAAAKPGEPRQSAAVPAPAAD